MPEMEDYGFCTILCFILLYYVLKSQFFNMKAYYKESMLRIKIFIQLQHIFLSPHMHMLYVLQKSFYVFG